jgi:hypothetical protein
MLARRYADLAAACFAFCPTGCETDLGSWEAGTSFRIPRGRWFPAVIGNATVAAGTLFRPYGPYSRGLGYVTGA